MRKVDFLAATKPITGGVTQTVSFNPGEITGSQVVCYHLRWTGATNTLADITRMRVKANGVPLVDIDPTFLRGFIQWQTRGRLRYPAGVAIPTSLGAAGVAQDWRSVSIPLCRLDQPTPDMQDSCQFPPLAQPTVEIDFAASAAAGAIQCGWTITDQPAQHFPHLFTSQMTIAASVPRGQYNLNEPGEMLGFGLNTIGLGRARIVLAGEQQYNCSGQPATSTSVVEDMLCVEAERIFSGYSYVLQAGTAAVDAALASVFWATLSGGKNAPPGNSFVELETLADWGGVANQVGTYAIVPVS